jgi:hypothetical protein
MPRLALDLDDIEHASLWRVRERHTHKRWRQRQDENQAHCEEPSMIPFRNKEVCQDTACLEARAGSENDREAVVTGQAAPSG